MKAIIKKSENMLDGKVDGKTVGVLGLSFKPDTDDMRDAPSRVVIPALLKMGAKVKAFDPVSMENAKRLPEFEGLEYAKDEFAAVKDADLVIIMTEWNEFKQMDLKKLKEEVRTPNMVDGRNIYSPQLAQEAGFNYIGVGL